MEYALFNQEINAVLSSLGGELCSLKYKDGTEYLWQGDSRYWSSRAPHLFPFVGRLTNGSYYMDGKPHSMDIHGFFRACELTLLSHTDTSIEFLLQSDVQTRATYPREFEVHLSYTISSASLQICFLVKNLDDRPMYFGYGGHPGFYVPLENGLQFSNYQLCFASPCKPRLVGMSTDCYVQGPDAPFPLINDRILPLRHDLFDNDALILRDMAASVTLESEKGTRFVTLKYPQMRFLGIWHRPISDAPYVCIEPWTSLPSRKGVVEAFEGKEDLLILLPGQTHQILWSISIGEGVHFASEAVEPFRPHYN